MPPARSGRDRANQHDPPAGLRAANDPLVFRKPSNGTVGETLKWDCYGCVDSRTRRTSLHECINQGLRCAANFSELQQTRVTLG